MIGEFRSVLRVFLCFKVRCFVVEKHRKFLPSKGEIVPIELPNPEETQLRKGENEAVRSRWHLHLLTNTVDVTVTVWLTSQKNLNLECMNCWGCRQRFLPLPDLSRKIEGDSVRRVIKSVLHVQSCFLLFRADFFFVRFRCRRRLALHDFIFCLSKL